jgi:3-hydroxyisobutyrate dehydrogenase-like beta-hydroxyacid dehydrogenase
VIKHVGFIGFGEAGSNFSAGLRETNPALKITAYDIRFPLEPALQAKATELGVTAVGASIAEPDLVFSFVVAKASVTVAKVSAKVMRVGQIYADCNSSSPQMKQQVAAALDGTGVKMVDCAVMSGVPGRRHKVPMNLSGPDAEETVGLLSQLGCVCEATGDQIGAASALKMMRSVMMKGIDALLLEFIDGARQYGVTEAALASMADNYPGVDWLGRAPGAMSRTSEHAVRRASKMQEVSGTLRAVGVEPMMAEATSRRIAQAAGLIRSNGGEAFTTLDELMAAMEATK